MSGSITLANVLSTGWRADRRLSVAAVVAVLGLVLIAWGLSSRGDAGTAAPPPSAEAATAPPTSAPTPASTETSGAVVEPTVTSPSPDPTAQSPTPPAPTATVEAELDTSAVVIDGGEWTVTESDVARIRDFIERTHELEFTGPVGVRISPDIGAEFAGGFEPFDEEEWMLLQALGMAGDEADRQDTNQLRRDRIRGLCCVDGDTRDSLSVVMEIQPSKFATEMILMHELVHALHVQHPELYPNTRYRSRETPLTFSAAVEGVPQYVVYRYLEMASEEDLASVIDDLPIIRDDMMSLIADGPAQHLNWAYATGADFVNGVVAERGTQGLSDLLGEPPSTNEQVLFPEKYLQGEQAVRVAPPAVPSGALVESEGTMGAAVLMWVLADRVGDQAALDFVATWAGDSYMIYDTDERRCLAATIMVDEQSREFGSELLDQLRLNFPDVTGESAAGTTITLDTCGTPR